MQSDKKYAKPCEQQKNENDELKHGSCTAAASRHAVFEAQRQNWCV
jgi:hypothetical protein